MIVDVFIVRRVVGSVQSIEILHRQMDSNAPSPRVVYFPDGEVGFVFAIDFHRAPAGVCTRLGYEYMHVGFVEIDSCKYTPTYALDLRSYSWIRVFLMQWSAV